MGRNNRIWVDEDVVSLSQNLKYLIVQDKGGVIAAPEDVAKEYNCFVFC